MFDVHKSVPNVWWPTRTGVRCKRFIVWSVHLRCRCPCATSVDTVCASCNYLYWTAHAVYRTRQLKWVWLWLWCDPLHPLLLLCQPGQSDRVLSQPGSSALHFLQQGDWQTDTYKHTHTRYLILIPHCVFWEPFPFGHLTCWVMRHCCLLLRYVRKKHKKRKKTQPCHFRDSSRNWSYFTC